MLISDHIKAIERKVKYINVQLKPLLMKAKFKLNVNLFKTLILPQYRLALTLYPLSTTK